MTAVHCCAHSEQLNMSCSRPGVLVRATSYSHIARPQLGHAGVLPTGFSDNLNKLDWGIASLLVLPTNPRQRNLFRASVCKDCRTARGLVALDHKPTFCDAIVVFAVPSKTGPGAMQNGTSALCLSGHSPWAHLP